MELHDELWRAYWTCSAQQSAHACLVAELTRKGLVTDTPVAPWRRFIHEAVLQFSLFGYVIARVTAAGCPQVYPGHLATLERRRAGVWVPVTPAPAKGYKGSGWRVHVLFEPVFTRLGKYSHPTSPAFKTLAQTLRLGQLEHNLLRRDNLNTDPAIYTSVSSDIVATKGSAVPWYRTVAQSAHIAGQHPLPTGPSQTTIRSHISAQAESIRSLNQVTDFARRAAAPAVLGKPPPVAKADHRENIVSAGQDYVECRHLQQDALIVHDTMDRLAHEIMLSWGVPPQVLGKNVNSERLASSNRLTEMAINIYLEYMKLLGAVLSEVMEDISGRVKFGDCTTAFVLEQCGPYLRPERAVELFAGAYDLDVSDFDVARFAAPAENDTTRPATLSEATKDAKRRKVGYG